MQLFQDFERTEPPPGTRSESLFHFLNRVTGPDWEAVRAVMNDWFTRWPVDAQADLRGRFQDDNPHQSIGAFWELYLHELHLRLGFQLERDPDVPGTTKHPDFLVVTDEGSYYLEATIIGFSDEEMATRRRRDIMLDLIDEAECADFWVNIKVPVEGRATPRRSEVVDPIEAKFATLNWEELNESLAGSSAPAPEFSLAIRDWVLNFRVYPRGAQFRGDPSNRTIGMGPSWSGVVDERQAIESDLKAKAKRYGRPDRPFVIAALCIRDFADDRSIEQALYGPEVVRIAVPRSGRSAGAGQARMARDPHGLWQWGDEQRATRVSAVLTASHINPWLMARADLTIWKNPWAALPLQIELPFRTVTGNVDEGRLVVTEGSAKARDVLGLHEGWPHKPV
jgi:hypothetical protein